MFMITMWSLVIVSFLNFPQCDKTVGFKKINKIKKQKGNHRTKNEYFDPLITTDKQP